MVLFAYFLKLSVQLNGKKSTGTLFNISTFEILLV